MDPHEQYMQQAIEVARGSKQNGGTAIGAIVVNTKTGEVIAVGGSQVGPAKDPTAHAEITAIRAAAQQIKSDDLFDFALYSTLEPCHMCLSASAWARIPKIYFGAYRKDVDETLFDLKGNFSDEQEGKRMNLRENVAMTVIGGVLEKECAALLAGYHELPKHTF